MTSTKLRVAVLFGGASHEKEISFDSGRNIFYKLSPENYQALALFVSSSMQLFHLTPAQLVGNATAEVEASLTATQQVRWSDLPTLCDFVFIGLHGGLGENGAVQGALEMLGIPYNGSSVLASALCMDKFKTTQYLQSQGFEVPASLLICHQQWQNDQSTLLTTILANFSLPLIVKPHDDGCSTMVSKAATPEETVAALNTIFSNGKAYAMVEEYVQGMELTVGVIGNKNPQALPPSQAIAHHDILSIEEKFLPGAGENQTPAPLPAATLTMIQRTLERAFTVIGCKGYARIDCFYQTAHQSQTGKERVIILEVNTLPGMTPATCLFHQAAEVGLKPADFINLIIKLGLQEHKRGAVTPLYFEQETSKQL